MLELIPFAFGIGGPEAIWIGVALVVLFGARKLPELARGLGEGMKEFKKAVRETTTDEDETPPVTSPDTAENIEKRIAQ